MGKWVSAWGVPTSRMDEALGNIIEDTTVRYSFYNNLKGNKIRFRFSNKFGTHDAVITKAYIAEYSGIRTAIVPGSSVEVTFSQNGNKIFAGQDLISDEINFCAAPGKTYMLSLYFKDKTYLETGYTKMPAFTQFITSYTRGDMTLETELPRRYSGDTRNCVFVSGCDVFCDNDSAYSIVAFGDSITSLQWPEQLMMKLFSEGKTDISVVRRAIGGNRVLRDYGGQFLRKWNGPSAISRIEKDLDDTPGAEKIVFTEGINDLLHPAKNGFLSTLEDLPTVEELQEGYKKCFEICRKKGIKEIYQGTLLPTLRLFEHDEERANMRLSVNDEIRKCLYSDGFIEFANNMKTDEDVHKLKPEFDIGDKLHPNLAGEKFMSELVYSKLFTE